MGRRLTADNSTLLARHPAVSTALTSPSVTAAIGLAAALGLDANRADEPIATLEQLPWR